MIPNGIDPDELRPVGDLRALRAEFAKPEEKLVLLVGRLVYEKGFQLALDALPGVIGRVENVRFLVAGSGTHEAELKAQAQRLGLDEHGTFLGWIGDDALHSLYRIADLCVVPSIYEPFGLVALEAMASGCPCIVADTGGLREVVPEGERVGLRFNGGDAEHLGTMIERLLVDEQLRDRLVVEASEHVLSFDWDDIATRTRAIYGELAPASGRGSAWANAAQPPRGEPPRAAGGGSEARMTEQPLMGLMQDDFPLNLQHVRRRMRDVHPQAEVVTLTGDGQGSVRASFAEISARVDRLARALGRLGIEPGDRVGTFAWNNQRHFELYIAVPCVGAVLHTLNVRLFAEQLVYIVNHAEDRVIFVDDSLVPLLEKLAPELPGVEHYILLGDPDPDPSRGSDPDHPPERAALRGAARGRGGDGVGAAGRRSPSSTPRSTSARPPRSATRAARPATRRACSTRTARSACTRPPRCSSTTSGSAAAIGRW